MKIAWAYGQQNEGWAAENLGRPLQQNWVLQPWEDLRQVKFWSLENVVQPLGGWDQVVPDERQYTRVREHVAAQKHIRSIFSRVKRDVEADTLI